jgi:hypothetical protein
MSDELDRLDAVLMLQVMQSYMTEPMASGRSFVRNALPDGLTKAQIDEAHPPGTEGWAHIYTVLIFWETIGGLLKQGLLREELAFDTILDAPPWPKFEQFVADWRIERDDPRECENFEYAYRRAMEFAAEARGRPTAV